MRLPTSFSLVRVSRVGLFELGTVISYAAYFVRTENHIREHPNREQLA